MNLKRGGYRLGGMAVALMLNLSIFGVVHAQQDTSANGGVVLGEVDRCNNGTETPASGIAVGVDGGSSSLAKTDENGQFVMNVAAGTYTVVATASDGSIATRPYVPVEGGVAIDIGILDLGGGAGGCGTDASVTAPVLPTFTPTATLEPTPPPPTATPVPPPPTPTVEATPVPDDSGDTGE
jgi:hypothetical protein